MYDLPAEHGRASLRPYAAKHPVVTLIVDQETFNAGEAVGRFRRSALEPTSPHITPRPFPLTCGPKSSPRSPPLPLFHSLPLSCADATMVLVQLVYKTEKASRGGAFSPRDPADDIFFEPR